MMMLLALVQSEGHVATHNTTTLVARSLMESCNRFKMDTAPRSYLFDSIQLPEISVPGYLQRIKRYIHCDDACFVTALIYMFRIQQLSEIQITWFSVHRLAAVATMVARKVTAESIAVSPNRYYSVVFGMLLDGMNAQGKY